MVAPEKAYFLFFTCVQAVDDVLNHISNNSFRWQKDVDEFRKRFDAAVDVMIEMAAREDWKYAFVHSGFSELYEEYAEFCDANWKPYFRDGTFRFSNL